MTSENGQQISAPDLRGDKALISIADDEFGLRKIVVQISHALATQIRGDGYAVGVEGPWGSGQSTFVNFIAEQLEKTPGQRVLRFEPWLIGDKGVLIAAFFSLLANEIDSIESSSEFGSSFTPWQRMRAKRKLSQTIRRYGEYVAALSGPLAGAATIDPTGATPFVAIGLKASGKLSSFFGKQHSLEKIKSEIMDGLHELRRKNPMIRFTVIIDDVDRLAPAEAVEILRMVQKVADFPNVTYMMCYDANVLSKQVRHTLLLKDGRRYTEKIFQEVIHVPPQEAFALRRALKAKLQRAFPNELAAAHTEQDSEYRHHLFLDVWCGELLTTPRDVARLFDSVTLSWPLLPPGSDFCDFLWLQLLKLKSHKLYAWVREYLQNIGAYRDGGRAGDTQPKTAAKALLTIMEQFHWHERAYLSGINSFLPGVGSFIFKDDKQRVFDFSHGELEKFEANSRLGSPSHWRQYFAFEAPSYALKDDDMASFRRACAKSATSATAALSGLFDRQHERRGHFVDLLLDRFIDLPSGSLSSKEANGMLSAFASKMDVFARSAKGLEEFGTSQLWRKSTLVLQKNKPSKFANTVRDGAAINWLSYVVRDQGFAYDLTKQGRSYPESQWLTKDELSEVIIFITRRYEALGMEKIFDLPSPLDALHCWVQLGDSSIAKQYFAAAVREDNGFLNALNALRGWQNSSETGVTHPLYDRTIEYFLNVEETFERLTALAQQRRTRKKASELLGAWKRNAPSDVEIPKQENATSDEIASDER